MSREDRAARPSGAAAPSPRVAARRRRWDRPDLASRRPGALGRLFFLHSQPGRERRPSRVRHVRGRVAPPPAGPPARPPSRPPAGRPAGKSQGRQVGAGPGGAAGGEGREGAQAGRGTAPSCSPALHIWFRFLSPGEVKVEGRALAWSWLCRTPCTPSALVGARAPLPPSLPPARVTRRPALLPSRPRPPARRLLSALLLLAQPPPLRRALCPNPNFPSPGMWALGPGVAVAFPKKKKRAALYRTLPWLGEGRLRCTGSRP